MEYIQRSISLYESVFFGKAYLVTKVVAVSLDQESLQKAFHSCCKYRRSLRTCLHIHHTSTALHRDRPCNAIHRGHWTGNTAFGLSAGAAFACRRRNAHVAPLFRRCVEFRVRRFSSARLALGSFYG